MSFNCNDLKCQYHSSEEDLKIVAKLKKRKILFLYKPCETKLMQAVSLAKSGFLPALSKIKIDGDVTSVPPDMFAKLVLLSQNELNLRLKAQPEHLSEIVRVSQGNEWRVQYLSLNHMKVGIHESYELGCLARNTPRVSLYEVGIKCSEFFKGFLNISVNGGRCKEIECVLVWPEDLEVFKKEAEVLQHKLGWTMAVENKDKIRIFSDVAVETPKIKECYVNSELYNITDKVLCVEDL